MTIELCIAHFNEDLDWLIHFPYPRITIYTKGLTLDPPPGIYMLHRLPNTGREAGTFLHHLVTRYDDLADVTIFLQGDPFAHCPIWLIQGAIDMAEGLPGYTPLSAGFGTDDRHGQPNNWQFMLPVGELYERIFQRPAPLSYRFACGGMFAATREAIHSKPLEWWQEVQRLCETEYRETSAWVMERLWPRMIMDSLTSR